MISHANMYPTKHSFLIPIDLWIWNLFNALSCRCLMMLGQYSLVIDLQNRYIKQLERYNDYTQLHIARAYIRAARAHLNKGELLQTIDKCMMAIYTYGYNRSKAYRICAKAYKVLSLNCPDFTQNGHWINELSKENRLFQQ